MNDSPKNGAVQILTSLAGSGNQIVQLCTLAMVAVTGIGNFIQGEKLSREALADRDRAVHQIHDLYQRFDDAEVRQRQMLELLKAKHE